jgi:signal transduction histidine kinase
MDMLTFSKEREPQRVEADLNETVRDVVELMQTRAKELNVTLESDLDSTLPTAHFDPEAMHRAILNLVTNAIDAASGNSAIEDETDFEVAGESAGEPVSPRVFVSTEFDPTDGWHIDVIDNGPGVSHEDREKIFSLFESRKGARGTGLGLPVSAKIMREHGGEIQILDTESGTGCCFRLHLPSAGTDMSELISGDTAG